LSAIDDKYDALRAQGVDLGAPSGNEELAAAGGRVRRYQHGNIYWCSATGAHFVRGGILNLYLANGGPGTNPNTGARDLGYPTSDEEFLPGTTIPHSLFEWGAIYWTPGTGGCVVPGAAAAYATASAGSVNLGLPITSTIPVAGGRATYFQRGMAFSAPGVPGVGRPLVGTIYPPLLGRPLLLATDDPRFRFIRWLENDRSYYDALRAWRPTLFEELLQNRFALVPVTRPTFTVSLGPVDVGESQSTAYRVMMRGSLEATADPGTNPLEDRTLYDLCCKLPNGEKYPLSQHAVYTKSNWENFGLLHVTDLHISARNDYLRKQLGALGLYEAAAEYSNFQDNLRDFIRYANKLHKLRLADAVVLTGDLVDYVSEDPDGEDNFARVRRIVLGESFTPGGERTEELELPVFTTLGNHDYRLHPYALRADVNLPDWLPGPSHDTKVDWFPSHNLIESEALALQGGESPSYGLTNGEEAIRPLQVNEIHRPNETYTSEFTSKSSYVVEFGRHKLVVLNTKYDNGIPNDWEDVVSQKLPQPNVGTEKLLAGRGPDSVGFETEELDLLRKAIADSGDAVVIAAIHCPPFHANKKEYPYYHRETIHPTAEPALTDAYVKWVKNYLKEIGSDSHFDGSTWPRTGTTHFKEGDLLDGFDDGFLPFGGEEFLSACVGQNLPRPVDLVLYGHHHERVEHRLRLNQAGTIEYFTDFYTENPDRYYATTNLIKQPRLPKCAKILVHIEKDADPAAVPQPVTFHEDPGAPGTPAGRITLPPYKTPLLTAKDPKEWWTRHRPLFAQTAALGPIDQRQRFGPFWEGHPHYPTWRDTFEGDLPAGYGVDPNQTWERIPGPVRDVSFAGFRFIRIEDGAIAKMRYINLQELREKNFKLPWEPEGRRHQPVEPVIEPVLHP
jgi:LGFP repeat/Calcineurin-like phosphoesterase